MNKSKLKSLVKSAKKVLKADIKLGLIKELKQITGKLGQESKKLSKEIEKGAEKLAKKISSEIKIDKSALPGYVTDAKPVEVVKVAAPKVKEKPVKKDTEQP